MPYGWRRAHSLPPSLSHHSGLNILVGLAVWRHKRRQQRELEAAKVSAAKAMQPEPAEGAGLDEEVDATGVERWWWRRRRRRTYHLCYIKHGRHRG